MEKQQENERINDKDKEEFERSCEHLKTNLNNTRKKYC